MGVALKDSLRPRVCDGQALNLGADLHPLNLGTWAAHRVRRSETLDHCGTSFGHPRCCVMAPYFWVVQRFALASSARGNPVYLASRRRCDYGKAGALRFKITPPKDRCDCYSGKFSDLAIRNPAISKDSKTWLQIEILTKEIWGWGWGSKSDPLILGA